MSDDKVVIPEEVSRFIEKIIEENDLKKSAQVKIAQGSELGDGYTAKTFTVDISDGSKSLHLFLKTPFDTIFHENLPMQKLFHNETYFYDTIYPAYREFLRERGVEDGFRNVPKCYAVSGSMIALENLKQKNFRMFGKGKLINDGHFALAARTFAKLHAVSFAFKDQRREMHENFKRNIKSCMKDVMIGAGFTRMLKIFVKDFLNNLDPVEDKCILEVSDNLGENLLDILLNIEDYSNEYSTITQGDCWTNNMLYLYEENDEDYPIDMMLVDWQILRNGSPATDLAYFFYTISSESTLENLEYYMKVYHEELSRGIRKLGSDPDLLYPYAVFKEEWKKFARYGLAMAFFALKGILVEKDEMPNMDDYPGLLEKLENNEDLLSHPMAKMKNDAVYRSRLKMIFKHFIKNGFL